MSITDKKISRVTDDGLFEVYQDGTIFRFNKFGKKIEAPKYINKINGTPRVSVSTQVDGKQKHYYVSRLVAEAFCQNDDPVNKTVVMFKDKNSANVHADNLYWATPKEMSEVAVKTRYENPFSCTECGNDTVNHKQVCDDCLNDISEKERMAIIRNNNLIKLNKIREEFENVNTDLLTPRQRDILQLRRSGCTLDEIGTEMGFSSERARQILRNIKTISGVTSPTDKSSLRRLDNRIKTINRQIKRKELEIDALIAEKIGIENAISALKVKE